jgi:iron complex outermembrane receptor protein
MSETKQLYSGVNAKRVRRLLPVIFLCALFFSVVHSEAQDNARKLSETSIEELLQLDLEQVMNYAVITPTKTPTPLFKTPGSVSIITYKDIQRSSATTIPELLRLVAGVNVRWNPMVQTIDIRGFGSNPFTNRVLLMIDGVPYNSWNKGGFPQHPGFDFFSLENIKHIEVIKGSASALYGENALSGVINILTLSGEEFRQTRAKVVVGENNHRTISVVSGDKIGDDASIFASLKVSKQQLPTEIWRENDSDARGYDLYLKGEYKDMQMSYFRRQDSFDGFARSVVIPGFLPPGSEFRSADRIKQAINIVSVSYDHDSKDDLWTLKAKGSFSDREGSHCAACHAATQAPDFSKTDEDHGYQLFTNVQLNWRGFKSHDLLLGAEYRNIDAGDHEDELATTAGQSFVTGYDKYALFLQDTWTLPWDRWQLVAGIRYDSPTSPDLFDGDLFPRLDIVGEITDRLVARFNWSQSVRYPSFSELYQSSGFFTVQNPLLPAPIALASFLPNPGIQPETINNFGFGLSYRFSERLHLSADFYQYRLEDPIVAAFGQGIIRFENHPDDARVRGMEVELRSQPTPDLSAFVNWAYQNNSQRGNRTDSVGNPIEFTYSPRHKVNFGATYSPRNDFDFTLEASWKDEYIAPRFWYPIVFGSPEVKPLDDYMFVNLRMDYKPRITIDSQRQPLTISLIGKNLINERPFETLTGDGRSNSGREFFLSLQYEWQH